MLTVNVKMINSCLCLLLIFGRDAHRDPLVPIEVLLAHGILVENGRSALGSDYLATGFKVVVDVD